MPNMSHFKFGRQVFNRSPDTNTWYRITNRAGTGPTQVTIYDEIGFVGVTAKDFVNDLSSISGDLELHLASNGGEVFDGIAIYNGLKQRSGTITVVVDSIAASIASVIAMAASPGRLLIAPTASMMVHDAQGMAGGPSSEMRKMGDLLDQQSDNIASIYAERTGKPAAYWRDIMRNETWYIGQQAVDAGLADRLLPTTYASTGAVVTNAATVPYVSETQTRHAPMTGTHSHDHGAFDSEDHDDGVHTHVHTHNGDADHGHDHGMADNGWIVRGGKWVFDPDMDGDDDSSAETDTDHGYWSADGKQLMPIPPKPTRAPEAHSHTHFSNESSVDNSDWDAAKAWHNGATSEDPGKFYAGICAGRKAGDPSKQSSWALPYKYTPSSAPNAAGVRNALSRLPQTEGLTNATEAKSKLEGLMKKINPNYDATENVNTVNVSDWNPLVIQAAF